LDGRWDEIRGTFQLDPPTEFTKFHMQKIFSSLGFDDNCSDLLLRVLQGTDGLVEFKSLSGFL
jgi:hypothetical protein